jgi:twinfilin-like protein
MSGLAFPLTDAAIESIKKFKSAGTDYVQLSIDLNKEIINVKNESTCTVQQLPSKVPEDEPRYHLFRFSHTHEGDFLNSTSKKNIRISPGKCHMPLVSPE